MTKNVRNSRRSCRRRSSLNESRTFLMLLGFEPGTFGARRRPLEPLTARPTARLDLMDLVGISIVDLWRGGSCIGVAGWTSVARPPLCGVSMVALKLRRKKRSGKVSVGAFLTTANEQRGPHLGNDRRESPADGSHLSPFWQILTLTNFAKSPKGPKMEKIRTPWTVSARCNFSKTLRGCFAIFDSFRDAAAKGFDRNPLALVAQMTQLDRSNTQRGTTSALVRNPSPGTVRRCRRDKPEP